MIGITGGSGYIGMALAKEAIDRCYKVRILDKKVRNVSDRNIEVIEGDIFDEKTVKKFLSGVNFIFHLAAMSNARDCSENIEEGLKLNILSTRLLLDSLKDSNISGFLFSSSVVALYGNPEYIPLDEKHSIKPVNDYGVMKRSSELFCESYYRSFGVPTVILRQSTIYGPSPSMKYDSAIHNFIRKSINDEPISIFGDGNQKRNFLWIDDLIDVYLKIYERMKYNRSLSGEIFNIAGPDVFTIREITRKISNICKQKLNKEPKIEFTQPLNEVNSRELKISVDKLEKEIGTKPETRIKEGLSKLFDYILKGESLNG